MLNVADYLKTYGKVLNPSKTTQRNKPFEKLTSQKKYRLQLKMAEKNHPMTLRLAAREQSAMPLLQHLHYGEVPELPLLQGEQIPCFAHLHCDSNAWAAGGGYETDDQQLRPYIIPDSFRHDEAEAPESDGIALEPPTRLTWDYQEHHEPNQFRHLAKSYDDLNLDNLTGDQIAVILEWFDRTPHGLYHDQISYIATALRKRIPGTTFRAIGNIFGLNKGTIHNHINAIGWSENKIWRPSWLTAQQMAFIEDFIEDQFINHKPASYLDISDFVSRELHIEVPMDAIRHHIKSLSERFAVVDGKPMDARRIECNPDEIDHYYRTLANTLKDIPSALVINLDETGHDEWGDKKKHKVVVPISFSGSSIEIPVARESKRSTVLGAIVANGAHLQPLVIVPRVSIETELFELGYTPDVVMYGSSESGFITSNLFDDWIVHELIPYVENTRSKLNYQGEAVVILDGCSRHGSDHFLDEMSYYGIVPLFLPAHSSDQTQPLDLGIFALEKAEAMRIRVPDTVSCQTRQVVKATGGYTRACLPNNVISAFRQAGIVSQWCSEHNALIAKVDRETTTKVRHWNLNRSRLAIADIQTPSNSLSSN
jgi:hypothetical protein